MYLIELEPLQSTLIQSIEYYEEEKDLCIIFKSTYYLEYQVFGNVPLEYFLEFSQSKSFGKFYLQMIKTVFKIKSQKLKQMATSKKAAAPPPAEKRKPKGINVAKKEKRFIDIDIDVTKINKDWLYTTEKGAVRLRMKLIMQPDGQVDQFENLGFISQTVPSEVWKEDKKAQGEILGNARENIWPDRETGDYVIPGVQDYESGISAEIADDLPF